MKVNCQGMSPEKAIRILRRKLENDGFKDRVRELEYYEKPTTRRKKAKAQAVKRQEKLTNEFRKFTEKRPHFKR
jgi:small subunit ribosomal protein S21|tara:strand:- start:3347 stop:3568 length:222 start_codon:yes stop_codon:yes gene_type:complete